MVVVGLLSLAGLVGYGSDRRRVRLFGTLAFPPPAGKTADGGDVTTTYDTGGSSSSIRLASAANAGLDAKSVGRLCMNSGHVVTSF